MKYQPYQPTKWERRVDAMFGLVSPKLSLNRMVDRERMHYFRYLAAQPSSSRQNSMPSTAGEWMKIQREKMQVMWNAIDMVDNSGLCSGILIKFPTYVCGTLRWQAKTGDKSINKMYQDYIKHKTDKPGNIDITGRFSLRTHCMLDVKSIALKGDVGTNIVRDDDEIYLQGIEANRIGNPFKWITSDTYVRGLNIDPRTGRPVSARIYHQDRRDGYYIYDDTFPFRDERGLPKFLFFTNPLSFDDYRGVSLFKHAIDNATYIDRMRTYELQALLWAASQSGVYYTKSGALPDQLPFSRTPVTDRDGNVIDTFEARPNTIVALSSEGEKVEMFDHDRPSPNVIGMYENTVRDIAIGAGLTYGFAYDMTGLTGPAVRQCSAQDARAIQIWQEMLREQKLDPVIMLLLGDGIARGELPYHQNWLQWDWFFPAKPTIDVGRESQANIEEIQACINTGASVVADGGGGDIEDVITQRSHEIELAIEAAQKVAQSKGLQWQEVYALMIPPPKGGGRAGAMMAANVAGNMAPNADRPGATDGGIDLNSDNGNGNGSGQQDFSVKKKDDSCFVIETDDAIIEFYNPDQLRDLGGRFADEGKGAGGPEYKHPDEAGLKGTDKKLVDIVPHRPLTRANEDVRSITDYVPGMHYVNYSHTPFFNRLNELQGTPRPTEISHEEFSAARKALFKEKGVKETLRIKDLIATQPVVNSEKVGRNIAEGKKKRIFVVRYGGKNFVMDGHHSLAGAAANGDRKVKARVITISNAPRIAQEFDAESGKTQVRGPDGRWTDEGKPEDDEEKPRKPLSATTRQQSRIGESKARGNSRTVSTSSYDILREQGKAYISDLRSGERDTLGLDANFEKIKGHAFEEAQKEWGGVTIDPRTGEDYKPPKQESGPYAISVKDPGQEGISIPAGASRDEFDAAMLHARVAYRQLGYKDHYLGVFHDNDKGTIDFDPVLIVKTPQQVEAVGAYTKSIGGAYDFATGKGYFPPHIKANSATSSPQRIELKRTLGSEEVTTVEEDEGAGLTHTSDVQFITFTSGKRGVFKPEDGENNGIRDYIDRDQYQREVAAGEVAEIIGMDDLVPASVIREVNGKVGSMQEMVENATAATSVWGDTEKFDGEKDLARSAAFDYLIYNTDRHEGNWMLEGGLTLHRNFDNPNERLWEDDAGKIYTQDEAVSALDGQEPFDGIKTTGRLRLIDNGLSFPSEQGGFANHALFDEAQSRGLDVPEEARQWQGKWPEIEKVLKDHGMDEEQSGGVRRRLMELANSATFNDLPEWEQGNRRSGRGPSMTISDDWTPTSESSEHTPAAIGGSRGTLETSAVKTFHAGRYPTAKELTGASPKIHASEWVDPRGGIHERKGPQSAREQDYDLFLKHQHGKVAVQDKADGKWHYEPAKEPLGTTENPKLPGLGSDRPPDALRL